MKTSLIIFGVIFLVVGGLLYFMPLQVISADTTTVGNGNIDSRVSSARVTVPVEWALASVIIGFVLLVLGFIMPGPVIIRDSKRDSRINDSYNKIIDSKENVEVGDGHKHKIVREHIETRKSILDDDSDDI